MRIVPRSIRGRMTALSILATLFALTVAGAVIFHTLERVVTQGIDRRLDAEIALLASSIGHDGRIDRERIAQLGDALYAGPGWQWQIVGPAETLGSADFPALDAEHSRRDHHGIGDRRGPTPVEGRNRRGERVHARQVMMETASGPVRLAASAPRSVIERPIRDAALPLLLLLGTLSALLAVAGIVQVRYGLRPLDRLRQAVVDIRTGRSGSIPTDQPVELQQLADELNSLARDNDAALAAARASAANLAHALKTPVATLALELSDQPGPARQVARIDETIRHHLARARDRVVSARWRTAAGPAIADLAATIARLHADRAIAVEIDIDAGHGVAVDPADFDEIMGNPIDNAMRHARSQISIRTEVADRILHIIVADDGPGIPVAERTKAMTPGVRLDERGEGTGFGLAIVRELTELYGGSIILAETDKGGLMIKLSLPRAEVN
ncbi:ATP-binding protein [Sphingopyxis sp.]|uniref:ATP-binding protein n=1 Tax=Sphingopyxis sp. TaxID=1908224 RepID=UPI003D0EDF0C